MEFKFDKEKGWVKYRCTSDEPTWCNKHQEVWFRIVDNDIKECQIVGGRHYMASDTSIEWLNNNFITLAEWREKQIDAILED